MGAYLGGALIYFSRFQFKERPKSMVGISKDALLCFVFLINMFEGVLERLPCYEK